MDDLYCLCDVKCLLCGHKVKTLNLPEKLPKKIILKCSKCSSNKNIVAICENMKFSFDETGIGKEEFINAVEHHELFDEEDDMDGLEGTFFGGEDDSYVPNGDRNDYIDFGEGGSMSSLEWDEDEEEWGSY